MIAASLTLLLAATPASTSAAPDAGSAPRSDDLAIKRVVDGFRKGMEAGDARAVFWPEAQVFHRGEKSNAAETVPMLQADGRWRWLSEDNFGRAEGALAYVGQSATVERGADAGSFVRRLALTFVLQRREGEWRILHLHLSEGAPSLTPGPPPPRGR